MLQITGGCKLATRSSLCIAACVLLSGCFFTSPKRIANKQHLQQTQTNLSQYLNTQENLDHPLTLSEAIARGLKYNLDNRIRDSQVLLANGQLTMAKLNMLPELNAEYNYTTRNNPLVTLDKNFQPSDSGVNPQTVEDQKIHIKWNLLDFGLSYVRAKQQADRVLIAEEQKRKIQQQLIAQIIVAYWKAYSAQEQSDDIANYRQQVELALNRSKQALKLRADSIVAQLDYQQLLIRSLRQLSKQQLVLEQAKNELAKLVNAKPNEDIKLVAPSDFFQSLPDVHVAMEKLDTIALVNRPELKEASYRIRIAKKGVAAAILEMLPGLDFKFGYNHTSNQYVKNQEWNDTNIVSTWNVFKLLRGPFEIANANTQKSFEKLTQAALTMGVLSQVRLAYNDYHLWYRDYQLSQRETRNADRLYLQVKRLKDARLSSQQAVIRRGIAALNAHLETSLAQARAYESLGKLRLSIGLNYIPAADVQSMPLAQLQGYIKKNMIDMRQNDILQQINFAYDAISRKIPQPKNQQNYEAAFAKAFLPAQTVGNKPAQVAHPKQAKATKKLTHTTANKKIASHKLKQNTASVTMPKLIDTLENTQAAVDHATQSQQALLPQPTKTHPHKIARNETVSLEPKPNKIIIVSDIFMSA